MEGVGTITSDQLTTGGANLHSGKVPETSRASEYRKQDMVKFRLGLRFTLTPRLLVVTAGSKTLAKRDSLPAGRMQQAGFSYKWKEQYCFCVLYDAIFAWAHQSSEASGQEGKMRYREALKL